MELRQLLEELLKRDAFWTVVGVVLGFSLGEGVRLLREWRRKKRLLTALRCELQSIKAQLPQKTKILEEMKAALSRGKILPGESVRMIDIGYRQYVGELHPYLTLQQRNCLHVIYERLRVADRRMESFVGDFRAAIQEGVLDDPFRDYSYNLDDLIDSCGTVGKFIDSYLCGDPIDPFYVDSTGS